MAVASKTKPSTEPTAQQRRVLRFIVAYRDEHGYPPTLGEIAKRMKFKSPAGVICHLEALERKGRIKRGRGQCRAIQVLNEGR